MKNGNSSPIKQVPEQTPPAKSEDCEPHLHKEQKKKVHVEKRMLMEPKDCRQEQLDDGDIGPT